MCGIAGWIDLKENICRNEKILNDMTDTLINRGPDASGKWISNHALIGHRRLMWLTQPVAVSPW
jgi:asparagine synthase (glutamine-hydrolysing)